MLCICGSAIMIRQIMLLRLPDNGGIAIYICIYAILHSLVCSFDN